MKPWLEKKRHGQKEYYYAVWKKRINGKVKRVKTVYLGTAETMMLKALSRGNDIDSLESITLASRPFGGAALMLRINELSGFTQICDRYLGSERSDSSPGAYLFLVVANRLLHPTSKNGIEGWHRKRSALLWLEDDNLAGVAAKRDGEKLSLSGQNIWNYMDMLTDDVMDSIWRDVTARIRERLSISDTTFFFDTTNFFDYTDDETNEEKGNNLPRRGYSKQHRSDKNQVSLSLFMGGKSMMPYSHTTYAGSIKDPEHFGNVVDDLKGFMKRFGRENVTLVIDRGCSTKENVSKIRDYFFISTLRKEEIPSSLLKEELRECYVNERGRTVYSSSGTYEVKGVKAKVVCTFSESLWRKHELRFRKEMEKAEELFRSKEEHAFRKERTAYRFAEKALPRNFRKAIRYQVVRTLDGNGFRLTWSRDEKAIDEMRGNFGRNFIFTTRLDWSDERIIKSYRSMYRVENQFKLLHSSMLVPVCPVRHWTDQKIEAHIFLCMVGLLFARTIEYVARMRGLNALSHDDGDEEKPASYDKIIESAENIQLVMAKTTTSHNGRRTKGAAAQQQIRFKLSNADDGFNRTILETFGLIKFVPGHQE